MKKRDLKVGMRVRIKSLEDIKKGVGVKEVGNYITFPHSDCVFLNGMEIYCGRTATVKSIRDNYLKLDFDDKDEDPDYWSYIPQMLEPVVEEGKISGVTINGEHIGEEEPKKQSFTKENLKFGNVVELRGDNALCLLISNNGENNSVGGTISNITIFASLPKGVRVMYGEDINDDLTSNWRNHYDIMKVYEDYTMTKLLWERKEIKLSDREIKVLEALKTLGFKVIARDWCGKRLYAYKKTPPKCSDIWGGDSSDICNIGDDLFQFIKWEDDDPYNIEELLKDTE